MAAKPYSQGGLDDTLNQIEALHSCTELLSVLRASLVEKVWSEHGAEQAALVVFQASARLHA